MGGCASGARATPASVGTASAEQRRQAGGHVGERLTSTSRAVALSRGSATRADQSLSVAGASACDHAAAASSSAFTTTSIASSTSL